MILVQNGLLPQYYNGRTSENSDLLIVYALEASSQCLQALFDRMAELMNRHSHRTEYHPYCPTSGMGKSLQCTMYKLTRTLFPLL